jgi:DNA-directed RNA polymerase specialized sigma24 family protein
MSAAMPSEPTSPANDSLGDPALRRSLEDFVRRRVPASDVDDVVQTVLCDALAAQVRPSDPAELRRWLLGIARHKVVDHHRRSHREPPAELPDIEASPAPIEARELVRWAERTAGEEGDAQKTLAWMAREGEGEKLEAIAAEEKVPAARVRQRVSRMRRWMKERWAAELAAVAMLAALAVAAWWLLRKPQPVSRDNPEPQPSISPEPPSPLERARRMRADAFKACDRGAWRECLDGLDGARGLDPAGDRDAAVGAARARAEDGLRDAPQSTATAAPTAVPAPSNEKLDWPDEEKKDGRKMAPPTSTTTIPKKQSKPAPKSSYKGKLDDDGIGLGAIPSDNGSSTPGTGTGKGGTGKMKKRASQTVLDFPGYTK